MATQTYDVHRIQAWSLMHEAILENDARNEMENELGGGSLGDEGMVEAAIKLREIGDNYNHEHSKDGQRKKTAQEIEQEIANLLKEKAKEIQDKYGRELDNLFRIDPSIIRSGILGSIYSQVSSRLAGLFSSQDGPKEKMGFLYHIARGVSMAVLPSGIKSNDFPIELQALNVLSAQFLLDECMPASPPTESLVDMINAVD